MYKALESVGSPQASPRVGTQKNARFGRFCAFVTSAVMLLAFWSSLDIVKETSLMRSNSTDPMFLIKVSEARSRKFKEEEDYDAYVNVTALIGTAKINPNRTTSDLPRTSTKPYNLIEPGKKYVLYSPSGGFSNQLMCFLSALYVAKVSNRTLLVPPKGRHSNLYWGYYSLKQDEIVPFDHALDFEYIAQQTGVELNPINVTLKDFLKDYLGGNIEGSEILHVEKVTFRAGLARAPHKYIENYVSRIIQADKPVVWAYGRFYGRYLMDKGGFRKFVRFAPYLREFARVIGNEALGGQYNAFHIRLGDYWKRARTVSNDARKFVKAATSINFNKKYPVYLATDSDFKGYFRPIYKMWRPVIKGKDLQKFPVVKQWLEDFFNRLPSTSIRSSLFGLVDQLVCVRAEKFVGTAISTFSKAIVSQRRHVNKSYPELALETDPPVDFAARMDKLQGWGYMKSPEQPTKK